MMTPEEYSRRFLERTALQTSGANDGDNNSCCSIATTAGLCGRFMKGTKDSDFEILSDEPGKLLSWVCSGEMLGGLLGMNPVQAMNSIGMRLDWVQCRINDGTEFRLVVFPVDKAKTVVVVTWENLWRLIAEVYGPEIDDALAPFKKEIEGLDTSSGYSAALGERGAEITRISNLSVHDKHKHPGFLNSKNFLAQDDRTLYHARGFLDHAVGCNHRFTGTGESPDGDIEWMMHNIPIAEIDGAVMIPLKLTQSDLDHAVAVATSSLK